MVLIALLVSVFASGAAQESPGTPFQVYGNITYENGTQVNSGTVAAYAEDRLQGQTEASDGAYSLVVEKESDESYSEVDLYFEQRNTGETVEFEPFGTSETNITVSIEDDGQDDGSDTSGSGSSGGSSGSGGSGGSISTGEDEEEQNEVPKAGFDWETPVRPGDDVELDASSSFDPDGNITDYDWSFGSTGETAETSFENVGEFQVTLTVIDDDGAESNITRDVAVTENQEPVPVVEVEIENDTVVLNASKSYDPDGEVEEYSWSFGGSSEVEELEIDGEREFTLNVTDDEGKKASLTRTVQGPQDEEDSGSLTAQFTDEPATWAGIGVLISIIILTVLYWRKR